MGLRRPRLSPGNVDRAIAIACAVVGALSVRPGRGAPMVGEAEALGPVFGVLSGLALLARSRRPWLSVAGATLAWVCQVLVAGPVVPLAPWVGLHGVMRHGRPVRAAMLFTGGALAVMSVTLLAAGSADIVATYVLVGLVAAMAGLVGAAAEDRRTAMRREAADEERLRLARELHDVVGHGLGAIVVQAGTGRVALEAGATDEAHRSLASIEETGRDALRETRWVLGLLREGAGHGLQDVSALASVAGRAGLAVSLRMDGDPAGVPTEVGAAAYRVAQEALTNVVRHARASRVDVVVGIDRVVSIEVSDDGAAADVVSEGQGLRGMRERVERLGGHVVAGPGDHGNGWRVSASIPVQG